MILTHLYIFWGWKQLVGLRGNWPTDVLGIVPESYSGDGNDYIGVFFKEKPSETGFGIYRRWPKYGGW